MIPVGLARCEAGYAGLAAPWDPARPPAELAFLLGAAFEDAAGDGAAGRVYEAVRGALFALGLDAANFGSAAWNPLGELVAPGACVVLKPNFIRHWNPCADGTLESVITHGAVLRPLIDYARLAVGADGRVVVAEAPQHDCDFEAVRRAVGLDEMVAAHARAGSRVEVIDLRRETVVYRDGVIVERCALPGDPAGYRMVDLGRHSHFHGSGLDPQRFRGADYDPGPTSEHHMGGKHEYLLSETVLSADLVINVPKLKTHKKTGVTLALKNLVGINGDKNLLPHHCVGAVDQGGDEFPGRGLADRLRSRATEVARHLLARGIGTRVVRAVRRAEDAARGQDFIRSGNWHGNQTTWRMCLDLNRCLYYSDADGAHFDAEAPVRRVLTLIDGVVAGEGEGPLAPRDRPLGVVLASLDPVALDLACIRLMGFDYEQLPKVREAMRADALRITAVRAPEDVRVIEALDGGQRFELELEALATAAVFEAHPGWRGRVEDPACAA